MKTLLKYYWNPLVLAIATIGYFSLSLLPAGDWWRGVGSPGGEHYPAFRCLGRRRMACCRRAGCHGGRAVQEAQSFLEASRCLGNLHMRLLRHSGCLVLQRLLPDCIV